AKTRANAHLGIDGQFAAVLFNKAFSGRKAQAGTKTLRREKWFKDSRNDVLRNSRPVVHDVDINTVSDCARMHRDLTVSARSLDAFGSILDKIDQNTAEAIVVQLHLCSVGTEIKSQHDFDWKFLFGK